MISLKHKSDSDNLIPKICQEFLIATRIKFPLRMGGCWLFRIFALLLSSFPISGTIPPQTQCFKFRFLSVAWFFHSLPYLTIFTHTVYLLPPPHSSEYLLTFQIYGKQHFLQENLPDHRIRLDSLNRSFPRNLKFPLAYKQDCIWFLITFFFFTNYKL